MTEAHHVEPFRYKLWCFFHDNYGLLLMESELEDIVIAVKEQLQREALDREERSGE